MCNKNNWVGDGLKVLLMMFRKSGRKNMLARKVVHEGASLEICYIGRPGTHPGRQQLLRIEAVEKEN